MFTVAYLFHLIPVYNSDIKKTGDITFLNWKWLTFISFQTRKTTSYFQAPERY